MQAGRDSSCEETAKLCIGRANTGGTIVLLEVVPHFFDHCEVSDSGLNQRGDVQGDVAEHFLIVLIPGVELVGRARGAENKPLALGPKVGLHGGMPLLPVGASENGDHFVKSAGHGSDKN